MRPMRRPAFPGPEGPGAGPAAERCPGSRGAPGEPRDGIAPAESRKHIRKRMRAQVLMKTDSLADFLGPIMGILDSKIMDRACAAAERLTRRLKGEDIAGRGGLASSGRRGDREASAAPAPLYGLPWIRRQRRR